MRRRLFLAAAAAAAHAGPAHAQAMRRVGLINPSTKDDPEGRRHVAAFRAGLAGLGWTEGKNLQIDYRWSGENLGEIANAAKELVALKPDVLAGRSTPVTQAFMRETSSIPIIFINVSDPVGSGIVASVSRPERNVTGISNFDYAITTKWLGLLKEVAPRVERIGLLYDPAAAPGKGAFYTAPVHASAPTLGIQTSDLPLTGADGVETTIAAFASAPDRGIIVLPDISTVAQRASIIESLGKHRVPAIFPYEFFVSQGGLMSYGVDVDDMYRQAGVYCGRVLQGEKLNNLPVLSPVKFEMAINLRAARTLGLVVPPTVLVMADKVIE
jgi:putative ABC transport system substrate-binding protein